MIVSRVGSGPHPHSVTMAAIEVVGFWANKIIMVASAALLGAFFCHWTVDHDLMWR